MQVSAQVKGRQLRHHRLRPLQLELSAIVFAKGLHSRELNGWAHQAKRVRRKQPTSRHQIQDVVVQGEAVHVVAEKLKARRVNLIRPISFHHQRLYRSKIASRVVSIYNKAAS